MLLLCDFAIIDLCEITTWDATIIQLAIGAVVASVFFAIQRKNTKMLNLIWKERFEHFQENTINKLLWMKNGCVHLQQEYKKVSKNINPIQGLIEKRPPRTLKEFESELKDSNERTIIAVKDYIQAYPETVSPQLESALTKIAEENDKIQITDKELDSNIKVLSEIINQIDLLNKKYNVKKRGKPTESIYENNLLDKIRSDRRKSSWVFIIPGILVLLVPVYYHGLFFNDILNDWVTYLGVYFIIFGITIRLEKDVWLGLWFFIGSFVMLALGILVGQNIIHF